MQELSFIIPVFNRAEKLRRCLDSLARSGVGDCEVIVVDDASTDETSLVRAEGVVSKVVRLAKNVGVTGAKNAGVEAASGDILVFLDSDDMLAPGAGSTIRQLMREHTDAQIIFGACKTVEGRVMYRSDMRFGKWTFRDLAMSQHPGEFLPICRRSVFEGLRYETGLRGFEGVTWLAAAKAGHGILYTNEIVRIYDDTGQDRLCRPENLARDYIRLARGFAYELRVFGADIHAFSFRRFCVLAGKACIYGRCADTDIASLTVENGKWGARIMLSLIKGFVRCLPGGLWRRWLRRIRGL